ncbi:MAG: cobalamin B12-binding domain-containing protein [Deltaproteobacteria bacterium]|nr:cobalamin B12-binding domain-containing protein [Deltaproteobacteria bacterium]
MARVGFFAMGADNVSVEVLSAALKNAGHETILGFDRALFGDLMYYTIAPLYRLFSTKKRLVRKVLDFQPDVIAFSVIVDNYKWCLDMAREIKRHSSVPIVFGGIHATTCPEEVIGHPEVDILCVGEGSESLVELADGLEKNGVADTRLKGFWFKTKEGLVRNPCRPGLRNLDDLPAPDKEIIKDSWNVRDYYLAVTSRGCIEKCSFCQQSFYAEFEQRNNIGAYVREQSVDRVIKEFQRAKELYGVRYIDIKNNVLSVSTKWQMEFMTRYPKEVGVPFRIMIHPKQATAEYCRLLKAAGCDHAQIGIESLDEYVKKNIIKRHDTNEDARRAVKNLDEAGVKYSCDFIFGLPNQKIEELAEGVRFLAGLKHCIRASVFWMQYLPGVGATQYAFNIGILSKKDLEDIQTGNQDHYMSHGSVGDEEKKKELKNFMLLYRLAPILPRWMLLGMLNTKVHKWFRFLPQSAILVAIDVFVSFIRRDYWALYAMKSYWWELRSRIDKNLFIRLNTPKHRAKQSVQSSLPPPPSCSDKNEKVAAGASL